MTRDISSDIPDWTNFPEPSLRDQEFYFRLAPTGESSLTNRLPINEYDQLLRQAPGGPLEPTLEERQPLREVVAAAMEQLSEQEQFVLDAVHSERLSNAQLAERLGVSKTQAWRLIQSATDTLRTLLESNPIVQERLDMTVINEDFDIDIVPTNWRDAAHIALLDLAPVGANLTDRVCNAMINTRIERLRNAVRQGRSAEVQCYSLLAGIGLAASHMLNNRGLWDVDEILDLLCRKQNDYGHTNILAFGVVGLAVRTSDKVARWNHLSERSVEALAEPLIDALVDIVGYAAIAQMLAQDTFKLSL